MAEHERCVRRDEALSRDPLEHEDARMAALQQHSPDVRDRVRHCFGYSYLDSLLKHDV